METFSDLERQRLLAMSVCEQRLKEEGFRNIAGVDEVGRGPLAGPVVAASCILLNNALFESLNDSKQLTPEQRDILYEKMSQSKLVLYGIGLVDVKTIDKINILQATFLAMQKAVKALPIRPDYLLIDGNQLPQFDIPTETLIGGDARSVSIAAASVIAKVTRDRIMQELDAKYPQYGFKQHKGYATEQHMNAIYEHGPCPIHRKSFDPVRSILNPPLIQQELFPTR